MMKSPHPVIQSVNTRATVCRTPRGASKMWVIDSDWSKAHVIRNGLFDWIWLWITCALNQSESTSQILEAPWGFDKLSHDFSQAELPGVSSRRLYVS